MLFTLMLGLMCLDGADKVCRAPKSLAQNPVIQQTQKTTRLYIFVSFAMPDTSLKAYAEEAGRLGATLVFRGLLNNSFAKTAQKLQTLKLAIAIDPTLFEKFGVLQIPTMILLKGETFDKIQGHISLKEALHHMADRGDLKVEAEERLQELKGGQEDVA